MKKLSKNTIIYALILSLTLILGACNKETSIPEGYQLYDDGAISFAYPDDWIKNEASIVILINESGIGNNISVVYESNTGIYENMTKESYTETYTALYEAMGLSVEINEFETLTNTNGLSIIKISQTTVTMGIEMAQTQYITDIGDLTYIITISETTPDAELVQNVFDTLNLVK